MATIKLTYMVRVERRAPLLRNGLKDYDISRAVEDVLRGSGIFGGQYGIQPETIRFEIEDD